MFFGDTQASSPHEVNYINHDVVEELIGTDAKFGITLGDIVGHDLDLFAGISQGIGQIGIPWYYIFGNHDNNRDAKNNDTRDETFEKYFGPSTYAFEYGQVVFIGINNVYFDSTGSYNPHFTENQIEFVKNYLDLVPENKLVVIMMHIPIFRSENKEQIFELIENRPNTFSISGHVHRQLNVFVGEEDGWNGNKPHHHLINATVCGSWWSGQIDEIGIPHSVMKDGAPNGYSEITFDGNQYSVAFKAARKPASYQMNIYAPNEVTTSSLDTTKVLVNVFAGSEKSTVEMKIGKNGNWQKLQKVDIADPECLRMYNLKPLFEQKYNGVDIEEILGWTMDEPNNSTHIWEGNLPNNLQVGVHTIFVRTKDMYGQLYEDKRIIYVEK
ncbi:MAG: metallophosphoesterase [Ignavibacteriae bacterium]|nr:metallophosphoesterase [Ignavibacteriota bacterium]